MSIKEKVKAKLAAFKAERKDVAERKAAIKVKTKEKYWEAREKSEVKAASERGQTRGSKPFFQRASEGLGGVSSSIARSIRTSPAAQRTKVYRYKTKTGTGSRKKTRRKTRPRTPAPSARPPLSNFI